MQMQFETMYSVFLVCFHRFFHIHKCSFHCPVPMWLHSSPPWSSRIIMSMMVGHSWMLQYQNHTQYCDRSTSSLLLHYDKGVVVYSGGKAVLKSSSVIVFLRYIHCITTSLWPFAYKVLKFNRNNEDCLWTT